jgi:hypothetical protein
MGKAGESPPGPAAKTALTAQTLTEQTMSANMSAHLEARMNTPLGTESPLLLDHTGWEKVSDGRTRRRPSRQTRVIRYSIM